MTRGHLRKLMRGVPWMALCLGHMPAQADWKVSRHDLARTGAAQGKSNLTSPLPYWRAYLGGELAPLGLLVGDVDGNKALDLVYLAGGRVTAASPDATVLWQTEPLEFIAVAAAEDLDGDGTTEVVAYSASQAFVLRGMDGKIVWTEPSGEMGTIAGVRLGDLDGDSRPELVVRECACCGVVGAVGAVVYSFATGSASPSLKWKLPKPSGCSDGQGALALMAPSGSGTLAVFSATGSQATVYDGATGAVLASTQLPADYAHNNVCIPANLDSKPGHEVICLGSPPVKPADDSRWAYALRLDSATNKLALLWSKPLAPYTGGGLRFVDGLADLDGDGTLEMAVSVSSAPEVWNTLVLDAASGVVKATLPDRTVAGHVQGAVGSGALLLTTSSSATLTAWSYDPGSSPPLAFRWSLPDVEALTFPDPKRVRVAGTQHWTRLATIDVDHDGVDEVLTRDIGSSATEKSISAWAVKPASPKKLATLKLTNGVAADRVWPFAPLSPSTPQLAVFRSDGHLVLVDDNLVPTNATSPTLPGVKTGGYFASGAWRDHQRGPVVGKLGAGPNEEVLATNSKRALVRLDASSASLASPPTTVWERTHTYAPAIVPGLDNGQVGVAALAHQEPVASAPQDLVVALRRDGSTIWAKSVPRTPLNDVLAGDLDLDSVPDLVVQYGMPTDTLLQTRALAGTTGATLWTSAAVDPGCGRQPAAFSLADWNSDGRSDIVFQALGTRVLSGETGSELLKGGAPDCYMLPSLVDLNADGALDVALHGGASQTQAWSHTLDTKLWTDQADQKPFPYGAIASCPDGQLLSHGSWQHPARVRLTRMTGSSSGAGNQVVLAGGKLWKTEADAEAKGIRLSQLTAASVHSNLAGNGVPAAAFGSGDGWLYAIDPCSGSLLFSYDFGAPVGGIVFGDTDGDGLDELIVTVADGHVYGMKQPPLAPPSGVLDTDPEHGAISVDVDDIETSNTLSAAWDAVPGATSYQVTVVHSDLSGLLLPWKDVGLATATTLQGLPLANGARYFFAVRALNGGAPSPDSLSDGVRVVMKGGADASADGADGGDAADADAGSSNAPGPASNGVVAGGGCDCALGPQNRGRSAAPVVLALAVLARVRRRARR